MALLRIATTSYLTYHLRTHPPTLTTTAALQLDQKAYSTLAHIFELTPAEANNPRTLALAQRNLSGGGMGLTSQATIAPLAAAAATLNVGRRRETLLAWVAP